MNNKYPMSPVVLFVYNRPEHTKITLDALNRLPEAKQTDLYIFSDEAKNEKAQDSVCMVRTLIDNFAKHESNFKYTEIRKAEKNKGLANSIIDGVTEIINHYGNIIVLEDDLEVSNDFLQYMNSALAYYKNEEKIWAISAYTFPMKALKNYENDVYICGRGCSWGWATWKNRWNTVDWSISDYSSFKFNIKKRINFAKWGKDMPTMLDACAYHTIQSWAIRWCYAAFKQNKMTIYPKYSRVVNNGTDGSGTNFKHSENKYTTYLFNGNEKCNFIMPNIDLNIQKEFSNKFITKKQLMNISIRWFLVKMGIVKVKSK